MITYQLNGAPFDITNFQVIDGIQYPVGWFYDKTNRDAMGITESEVADDLIALKAAKRDEINQWRASANLSTFMYVGKQIACDALSRSDIDGVANNIALIGNFPDGFPYAWKTTDDTYLPIPDIATFKAMYAAMTAQGAVNFARSQTLKSQLDSATTTLQISTLAW